MRKLVLICIASVMSFAMVSCGSSSTDTTGAKPSTEVDGNFMVHPEKSNLRWTAYKFTERVGVSGVFTDFTTTDMKKGNSVPACLEGMNFNVNTSSIDSHSEDRDAKLQKFFFGTMKGGEVISGQFGSYTGDGNKGNYTVNLVLNKVRNAVDFQYTVADGVIVLKAKISLGDFDAQKSVDSINMKCDVLHKGSDGISKLWPEVNVEVHIPYTAS